MIIIKPVETELYGIAVISMSSFMAEESTIQD